MNGQEIITVIKTSPHFFGENYLYRNKKNKTMGYTHYFRRKVEEFNEENFKNFINDSRKILNKAADEKIYLANSLGEIGTAPTVNKNEISFNGTNMSSVGKEDFSYESFFIKRKDETSFNFCKTQFRPYDKVVVAVLIAAKKHLGDEIIISSDGDEKDWEAGKKLAQEAVCYGEDFSINIGDFEKDVTKFFILSVFSKNDSDIQCALLRVNKQLKNALKLGKLRTDDTIKIMLSDLDVTSNFFFLHTTKSFSLLNETQKTAMEKVLNKLKDTETEGYFEIESIDLTEKEFDSLQENTNFNWSETAEVVLTQDDVYLTTITDTDYIESSCVSYVELDI